MMLVGGTPRRGHHADAAGAGAYPSVSLWMRCCRRWYSPRTGSLGVGIFLLLGYLAVLLGALPIFLLWQDPGPGAAVVPRLQVSGLVASGHWRDVRGPGVRGVTRFGRAGYLGGGQHGGADGGAADTNRPSPALLRR
ncbi:hypothetical protein ACU4GD_18940 [Cupriavidus basilensis]